MNPDSTSLIGRISRRLRRELGFPVGPLDVAIRMFGRAHPDAIFVQVGANDGVTVDPLRAQIKRRQWTGIMVEPVPYNFKRLAERYGDHPRVHLEMCAISEEPGELPFYHVRQPEPGEKIWPWYHALGSFRREVLVSHTMFIPDIEERVAEIKVPCKNINSLCEERGLPHLDLLQIDTEGYDYEVLRSVDLETWRPRLVIYEHHHLDGADRREARRLLQDAGYLTFEYALDTLALDSTRIGPADKSLEQLFLTTPDQPSRALNSFSE